MSTIFRIISRPWPDGTAPDFPRVMFEVSQSDDGTFEISIQDHGEYENSHYSDERYTPAEMLEMVKEMFIAVAPFNTPEDIETAFAAMRAAAPVRF